MYIKYISIKEVVYFQMEKPFSFNKFVFNLYFYCNERMWLFYLWNLLRLSLWTNTWSNCMNVSCIEYESGKTKKYSLNLQYCFVYVFYILRFYPLDLCLFLNLLKLRTHYCLALCYCYWEIWCQTEVLSFVNELVILLWGLSFWVFFLLLL